MLQLNTINLHSVMRDFYTLTQIRIVIFDADFQEVLAYPTEKEGFCAMLRRSPEGEAACQISDKNGCLKCAKTKDLVLYKCHAGLTEAVVPIFDKNGVLAYVMFGQIVPQESDSATIAKIKNRYPAFATEINRIPIKSVEELNAAATILQAITSYVITNRWVTPGKSEFIRQIDRYIEDHLNQSITMEEICEAFRIGRARLYELSLNYLGCGLSEYIRKQRIHHAQQILKSTNLHVTDIAYAVGFSDYNHFSRVFKHVVGVSARTYRKNESNT